MLFSRIWIVILFVLISACTDKPTRSELKLLLASELFEQLQINRSVVIQQVGLCAGVKLESEEVMGLSESLKKMPGAEMVGNRKVVGVKLSSLVSFFSELSVQGVALAIDKDKCLAVHQLAKMPKSYDIKNLRVLSSRKRSDGLWVYSISYNAIAVPKRGSGKSVPKKTILLLSNENSSWQIIMVEWKT